MEMAKENIQKVLRFVSERTIAGISQKWHISVFLGIYALPFLAVNPKILEQSATIFLSLSIYIYIYHNHLGYVNQTWLGFMHVEQSKIKSL